MSAVGTQSSGFDETMARAFMLNPVGMAITSGASQRFTAANQAFLDICGYWRADVIGASSSELRLWPDARRRDDVGAQLQESGRAGPMQAELRTRSGNLVPIVMAFRLLDDLPDASVLSVVMPQEWIV